MFNTNGNNNLKISDLEPRSLFLNRYVFTTKPQYRNTGILKYRPIAIPFFIILFLLANIRAGAQTDNPGKRYLQQPLEQHRFEEPVWVEATKDLDYSPLNPLRKKEERPRKERQKEKGGEADREEAPSFQIDRPLLTNIVKFFLILIAAVAIALLLKHLLGFGNIPWNKKIKPQQLAEIRLETIEENLHEAEMDPLIRRAVEEGQYALAIRLYFLAILKELSLMQAIRWKKNKTNREYLRELKSEPDHADFGRTARIFERIWYGNRVITAGEFRQVEPPFADFLHRLQEQNRGER
jgi:hypothetical protein